MSYESARKAFVMLSAAVTMTMMGTAAAEAGARPAPPSKGKIKKNKKKKAKRGKVKRVRRAKRRPSDFDPDLGMPAGTAYDVIKSTDLP